MFTCQGTRWPQSHRHCGWLNGCTSTDERLNCYCLKLVQSTSCDIVEGQQQSKSLLLTLLCDICQSCHRQQTRSHRNMYERKYLLSAIQALDVSCPRHNHCYSTTVAAVLILLPDLSSNFKKGVIHVKLHPDHFSALCSTPGIS